MAHHRCAWIYRHSESYIAAGRKMPASTGQYGSQCGSITMRYSIIRCHVKVGGIKVGGIKMGPYGPIWAHFYSTHFYSTHFYMATNYGIPHGNTTTLAAILSCRSWHLPACRYIGFTVSIYPGTTMMCHVRKFLFFFFSFFLCNSRAGKRCLLHTVVPPLLVDMS